MLKDAVLVPCNQAHRQPPETISYRVVFDSSTGRNPRILNLRPGVLPEDHLDVLGVDRGTYVVALVGLNK